VAGDLGVVTGRSRRPRKAGPSGAHERQLAALGFEVVAGLDEVGRGAWAGPVSVGVVVFPADKRPPEACVTRRADRGAP
jgi:hypothetical protein